MKAEFHNFGEVWFVICPLNLWFLIIPLKKCLSNSRWKFFLCIFEYSVVYIGILNSFWVILICGYVGMCWSFFFNIRFLASWLGKMNYLVISFKLRFSYVWRPISGYSVLFSDLFVYLHDHTLLSWLLSLYSLSWNWWLQSMSFSFLLQIV